MPRHADTHTHIYHDQHTQSISLGLKSLINLSIQATVGHKVSLRVFFIWVIATMDKGTPYARTVATYVRTVRCTLAISLIVFHDFIGDSNKHDETNSITVLAPLVQYRRLEFKLF